ncbi:MAG TPA: hypothetical protein VHE57_12655 [Mycobacteriales bacterium]|nr:hypothetical protein [Mycobacteriales bacterium]
MKKITSVTVAALTVGGLIASVAPASAHPSAAALTKARATSIATAINLKSSDFPDYSVTPYQPSAQEKAEDKRVAKCVGEQPEFVDVTSAEFDNSDGYGFSSETSFVSSLAAVKTDARRATSAHARSCFKQELQAAATEAGASSAKVTVTPVHESAVSGLDAVFAMKFAVTFSVLGQNASLYGYDFGFGRGNAEVSLTEIGSADVPASASTQTLATLVSRAKHNVPAAGFKIA